MARDRNQKGYSTHPFGASACEPHQTAVVKNGTESYGIDKLTGYFYNESEYGRLLLAKRRRYSSRQL